MDLMTLNLSWSKAESKSGPVVYPVQCFQSLPKRQIGIQIIWITISSVKMMFSLDISLTTDLKSTAFPRFSSSPSFCFTSLTLPTTYKKPRIQWSAWHGSSERCFTDPSPPVSSMSPVRTYAAFTMRTLPFHAKAPMNGKLLGNQGVE